MSVYPCAFSYYVQSGRFFTEESLEFTVPLRVCVCVFVCYNKQFTVTSFLKLMLLGMNCDICSENEAFSSEKKRAPPGNRTRVARMGILHDTTTPAAPMDGNCVISFILIMKRRNVGY